jgi:uncharacterized membrane protein YkvA (DUF1232 family)
MWRVFRAAAVLVGLSAAFSFGDESPAETGTFALVSVGAARAAWGQVYDVSDRPPRLRQLTKEVRSALRRFRRQVAFALGRWQEWLPKLGMGVVALVLVGAADRQWVDALRRRQWRVARAEVRRGANVVVGLLLDSRTPAIGKLLWIASLLYLVAVRDLVWDRRGILGFCDDLLVLLLAGRAFLATCPDRLVEEWAHKIVAREKARERGLHRFRRTPPLFRGRASSEED